MDEVRAWLSLLFDVGSFIVNVAMLVIAALKNETSSDSDEVSKPNED